MTRPTAWADFADTMLTVRRRHGRSHVRDPVYKKRPERAHPPTGRGRVDVGGCRRGRGDCSWGRVSFRGDETVLEPHTDVATQHCECAECLATVPLK